MITFVPGDSILIGTGLMAQYRLTTKKATKNKFEITLVRKMEGASYSCMFSIKPIKSNYGFNLYLDRFPTQNCQLSSIGCMGNFLHNVSNKNDVRAIIKECYRLIQHDVALIIMDVQERYITNVERCFEGEIEIKNPYTSTNTHKMCLFIVNGKKI